MRANPTDLPAEPVPAGLGSIGRDPGGGDPAEREPAVREHAGHGSAGPAEARQAVTALYQAHALGLIRLAVVMLGDRPAAEDVVQEAFCGLYRRWHALADTEHALSYVRSSVINGCRSALRRRVRQLTGAAGDRPGESAESAALVSEEHRQVLAAIRRLPSRQREALVLRYYLDLDEAEIAMSMRISRGTVKSTTSRALAALGRLLGEQP